MFDINKSMLFGLLGKLRLNSSKSVQDGSKLSALDEYLHVERPVEKVLIDKMEQIEHENGGIVFLVGSAGDGKSHLLSRIRKRFNWPDSSFYNDATASYSPKKTAVETLKETLVDYNDDSISHTNRKLVIAINLGKLSAFIEDKEARKKYSVICKATEGIFNDSCDSEIETERLKIVRFDKEQNYEIILEKDCKYPVRSYFMSTILAKIVSQDSNNPFYTAYQKDKSSNDLSQCPVILNYELLFSKDIRDTIVNLIIEASIRFKLAITPREYLDALYNIIVFRNIDHYHDGLFYDSLLPTLLFSGGNNQILRSLAKLDPLKYSNSAHNQLISKLMTSYEIPHELIDENRMAQIPPYIINKTNEQYHNNGRNLEATMKFVFHLIHTEEYHSDSEYYLSFIRLFSKAIIKDETALYLLYEMVSKAIPRHYGLFTSKENCIPLSIQGGRFKLLSELQLNPSMVESDFDPNHPSRFNLYITLEWELLSQRYNLKMDYQVFSYISELNDGRLVSSFNNDGCLPFSSFIREVSNSIGHRDILIVGDNSQETKIKSVFGKVRIS